MDSSTTLLADTPAFSVNCTHVMNTRFITPIPEESRTILLAFQSFLYLFPLLSCLCFNWFAESNQLHGFQICVHPHPINKYNSHFERFK